MTDGIFKRRGFVGDDFRINLSRFGGNITRRRVKSVDRKRSLLSRGFKRGFRFSFFPRLFRFVAHDDVYLRRRRHWNHSIFRHFTRDVYVNRRALVVVRRDGTVLVVDDDDRRSRRRDALIFTLRAFTFRSRVFNFSLDDVPRVDDAVAVDIVLVVIVREPPAFTE